MNCNSAFLVHTDLGQSPRCSTCLALMFTRAYISTTPILRRLQSIGDNRTENSAAIIGTLTLNTKQTASIRCISTQINGMQVYIIHSDISMNKYVYKVRFVFI